VTLQEDPQAVAHSQRTDSDAGRAAFQSDASATSDQMADLDRYRDLLIDWNGRMNLMGPSGLQEFWSRHVWDSAQLLSLAPDALTFADLGTGAGFPGIVLAILLKDRPGARIHLVESMAKRCRFLQTVVEDLALPATVHHQRAEDGAVKVDVVTARACAPMDRLLGYAKPWMKLADLALFLKGGAVETEIAEARKGWTFKCELIPSQSGSGQIVRVVGAPVVRR
jgi:16S rRNA (guanine527-N7)-methyltransferase